MGQGDGSVAEVGGVGDIGVADGGGELCGGVVVATAGRRGLETPAQRGDAARIVVAVVWITVVGISVVRVIVLRIAVIRVIVVGIVAGRRIVGRNIAHVGPPTICR